jgi:hypothetical protein
LVEKIGPSKIRVPCRVGFWVHLAINIRYSGIFFASERWSFALNWGLCVGLALGGALLHICGPCLELCSIWLALAEKGPSLVKGLALVGFLCLLRSSSSHILCSSLRSRICTLRYATLCVIITPLCFASLRILVPRICSLIIRYAHVSLLLRASHCAY